MRQVEIAYKALEQEFKDEFKKLGTAGLYERGILATSSNDFVIARKMRFIPDARARLEGFKRPLLVSIVKLYLRKRIIYATIQAN